MYLLQNIINHGQHHIHFSYPVCSCRMKRTSLLQSQHYLPDQNTQFTSQNNPRDSQYYMSTYTEESSKFHFYMYCSMLKISLKTRENPRPSPMLTQEPAILKCLRTEKLQLENSTDLSHSLERRYKELSCCTYNPLQKIFLVNSYLIFIIYYK